MDTQKALFVQRLKAFLIDFCIFALIPIFIFNVVIVLFFDFGRLYMPMIYGVLAVVFLLFGFKDIFMGQSIGKRAAGIAVRDASDNAVIPSASRLFLRQILTLLWPIELFVLAFSRDGRKIGDKIAKTDVFSLRVQNRHNQSARSKKGIRSVLIVVTLFVLVLFLGMSISMRNHAAFHVATDTIREHPEIVAAIGEIQSFGFFITGGISTSGNHGNANFTIRARGSHGRGRMYVRLQRHGGTGADWEVVRLEFVQTH